MFFSSIKIVFNLIFIFFKLTLNNKKNKRTICENRFFLHDIVEIGKEPVVLLLKFKVV